LKKYALYNQHTFVSFFFVVFVCFSFFFLPLFFSKRKKKREKKRFQVKNPKENQTCSYKEKKYSYVGCWLRGKPFPNSFKWQNEKCFYQVFG